MYTMYSTVVTSCSPFLFPFTATPFFPRGCIFFFFKDLATNQSSAKIKSTDGISDLQGPFQSCTMLHFISFATSLPRSCVFSIHIHPPGALFHDRCFCIAWFILALPQNCNRDILAETEDFCMQTHFLVSRKKTTLIVRLPYGNMEICAI